MMRFMVCFLFLAGEVVVAALISSCMVPILRSQIAVHLSFFYHGDVMGDMTYDAYKMLV